MPYLQPLEDIHLHSVNFQWDIARRGNIRSVYALVAVGIFLLLIALVNYVNLSTAKSLNRAREVGVRKVSGARRSQLIGQFISEAVLVALLACTIALVLAALLLPALNDFTGKHISFGLSEQPLGWLTCIAVALFLGVLSGIYPAILTSHYQPIKVLKNQLKSGPSGGQWMRKGLVVLQFTLSVLLMISSWVIFQQVELLNHKDLGFDREHMILFPMRGSIFSKTEEVKEEFKRLPGVISATAGFGFPSDIVAGDQITVPEKDQSYSINLFAIDYDYISTMGLELVSGRGFSREYGTDESEAFILNETAVRELGFKDPQTALGKRLDWGMWNENDSLKKGRVIGVVKDFHFKSLREIVSPAVLQIYPGAYWKMVLKLRGENLAGALEKVQAVWDSFETGYPLDYQFIDQSFGQMYEEEKRLSTLLAIFTALTIAIALIGLLGLVSYHALQKRKEIGIRKVMGATVSQIVVLLTRQFTVLILIAMVIAIPLAVYLTQNWLNDFPYRIQLNPWMVIGSAGIALLIAWTSIGLQSVKAASGNPVESLRYE